MRLYDSHSHLDAPEFDADREAVIGRAATEATHFVSVTENVKPYKVGAHRHTPEIEQEVVEAVQAYRAERRSRRVG